MQSVGFGGAGLPEFAAKPFLNILQYKGGGFCTLEKSWELCITFV